MERLTEKGARYSTCDGEHDIIVKSGADGSEEPICDLDEICKMLNRLAEYEDKRESGHMIELKCGVGDTVYCARRNRNFKWVVSKTTVTMILIHSRVLIKCACSSEWQESDCIFFDRKQATAKLKELQEKG